MRFELDGRRVPGGFAAEVRRAAALRQAGRLGLLGLEAGEFGWKVDGLALVAEGLALVGGAGAARVACGLGLRGEEAGDAEARAVVFTGHMIDAAGRERERFPARAEGAARAAIREAVLSLTGEAVLQTVGVAGGASGGDLLFHEVCAELGVRTVLRLTLPVEAFLAESVAPAGIGWVTRLGALMARLGPGEVKVLGEGLELPEWMGARADYDVWQRTNLWLVQEAIALAPSRTLLALWDGEPGDGPGGTQHLVEAAARYGMEVAPTIMTEGLLE